MDRTSIGRRFNIIQEGKFQPDQAADFVNRPDQLKPGMTIQVSKEGKNGVVMYLAQKKLKNLNNLISAAGRPKTNPSALDIVLKKMGKIGNVKGMDMEHAATYFRATYRTHDAQKAAVQRRAHDFQQRLAGDPQPTGQTRTAGQPQPMNSSQNDRRWAKEFDPEDLKAGLAMEELELAAKDKRIAAASPKTAETAKPVPENGGINQIASPPNPFMEDTLQFQFAEFTLDNASATATTTSSSATTTSSASPDNTGSTASEEIPK